MSLGVLILIIAIGTCIPLTAFGRAWGIYDRLRATEKRNQVEFRAKGFALAMAWLSTALCTSITMGLGGYGAPSILTTLCIICLFAGIWFSNQAAEQAHNMPARLRVV